MICEFDAADCGPIGTLRRIIRSQQLAASKRLIRGDHEVVCFTEVSPESFPKLRIFRKHLRRWDFLPYGVAITRAAAETLGIRPVQYGDDQLWEDLTDDQRPFFQQQYSAGAKSEPTQPIDWSVEQEWRCRGNVELSTLNRSDVLVFVATFDEAIWIASISPWRVVVMEAADRSNGG